MKRVLFITGCSGYIGHRLTTQLAVDDRYLIYGLTREPEKIDATFKSNPSTEFVKGGIFDSDEYASYLEKIDTVIHLAAVTGKNKPEEYFRINVDGTRFLIQECQKAGIENFLYASTIAVKYNDKSNYYYAQSKLLGEEIVRKSGLNFTIVRPTIVIGRKAPIWESLVRLAKPSIPVIFGDGTTPIQPIYLDDLVDCLLSILSDPTFANETIELGGPEVISFEDLLGKIHYSYRGKLPRQMIRIPLKPLKKLLSGLEGYLYSYLPLTAGQLSAFANDGTIETNRVFDQHIRHMRTIDEMIALSSR